MISEGSLRGDLGGFGPFGGVPCWSYDRNFPTVVSMWRCDAPIVRRAMSGQHQYYRSTPILPVNLGTTPMFSELGVSRHSLPSHHREWVVDATLLGGKTGWWDTSDVEMF